jgi:hypothetical protein
MGSHSSFIPLETAPLRTNIQFHHGLQQEMVSASRNYGRAATQNVWPTDSRLVLVALSFERCLSLLPAILASFAIMTSFLFSFWCESIKFAALESSEDLPDIQAGVWYVRDTERQEIAGKYVVREVCVDYPSGTDLDSEWRTVRAFSIITGVIGGILAFVLWISPCLYFLDDSRWRSVALLLIVVMTLFQGLTFLLFRSVACTDSPILDALGATALYDDECEWDSGSTANVFSTVLWFCTGIAMLALGAPQRPERPPTETQTVTYQQTENPEGGTTVVQVNVVKGTVVPKEDSMSPAVLSEESLSPAVVE